VAVDIVLLNAVNYSLQNEPQTQLLLLVTTSRPIYY